MGDDTLGGLFICVCTQCVRAKRAHVCVHLFLDGLSQSLLGIYYESPQVACTIHVQARACVWQHVWLSVR
jgi:hypothetical protein